MKRYLAIDPGDKRTGLAVGDALTGPGPVGVIEATTPAHLLRELRDAIDAYAPDALVVGIPYNMDGSAGPAAKKAEALAQLLEVHTHLQAHRFDERLTSYAADEQMQRSGLTRRQKKSRRDALAATAILRDFLESRRTP